jgi:hypothetical protein
MLTFKEGLLGFALALAVTTLASVGFAQTADTGSSARTQAIHECSARASKHSDYSDEVNHLSTFRACMGDHGFQD